MMADSSFLKSLIEFDKDNITEKQVNVLRSIDSNQIMNFNILKFISRIQSYKGFYIDIKSILKF